MNGNGWTIASRQSRLVIAFMVHVCTIGSVGYAGRVDILPPGFVRLASVDATIHQDIRYATSDNFVGRPIPGYEIGECWLRRRVADALSGVQADLSKEDLQLVVYDCYRPTRAVDFFIQWVRDPTEQSRKADHYPALDKSQLLVKGYLAIVSAHSKGIAVDVGLARRASGDGGRLEILDMGTPFDFFGPRAHTSSPLISGEAGRNRTVLVTAMARRGFRNYPREWWHFSLPEEQRLKSYDVSIRP
jgi:D-alanyl-D-alanine dipeptidase